MTTAPASAALVEAWDASHFHLRLAIAARRGGEVGAAAMYSATAAAYASRARALKDAS
jgi:hypothetical protein